MYFPFNNQISPKEIKPETKEGYTSEIGFEVFRRKLIWQLDQHINTLKYNYEDFMDIEGELSFKLSVDEHNAYYNIDSFFDDGKEFVSEAVREEYRSLETNSFNIKELGNENHVKRCHLVKHMQQPLQQGETNDK